MSGLVMGLVWELPLDGEFDKAEKYILLAYADHADQAGKNVFPSVDLICEKTGYSERAVQKTTRSLEKLGYLVRDGIGMGGTNRFYIPVIKTKEGGAKIAPVMSQNAPEGIAPPPMSQNAPEGNAPEGNAPELKDSFNSSSSSSSSETSPNIFSLYEENIGLITPLIKDALIDAEQTYPREWIISAFRIAVEKNARTWNYVRAVLQKMQAHGPGWKPGGEAKQAGTSRTYTKKPRQSLTDAMAELAEWAAEKEAENVVTL